MSPRPSRNVRFVRTDLKELDSDQCEVRVELKGASNIYFGQAHGRRLDAQVLRTAAEAAANALRQLGHAVDVQAVETVQAVGEAVTIVRVVARYEGEARTLVGLCTTADQPLRASVLAVLNATNRFLEIG